MKSIKIFSRFKNYNVYFINDLRQQIKRLNEKHDTHFLIDKNIFNKYKNSFTDLNHAKSVKIFDAIEKNKNLDEVLKYIKFLLKNKIQKKHKIVVVGGGLVQDIGSFSSHTILRGIDWIFFPTTLLSMADSCIGSKSGINVLKYKNQVGSFHAPLKVYIYSRFLRTLSKIDLLNGIGEIIKHSLIKGEESFLNIINNLNFIPKDLNKTEKIIYESLLIKKEIIEEDEYEENTRRLLNYGHTFGHALEGYTGNEIPHGIGISIGIDIANFISMKRGLISKKEFEDISKVVRKYIPYQQLEIKSTRGYINFLKKDKKAIGDEINVILCEGIGKIKIVKIKLDLKLISEIEDFFNSYIN